MVIWISLRGSRLTWSHVLVLNGPKNVCIYGEKVSPLRDHAQNTTNPAISLVVYNVIPLMIGPPA